jgi:hypothetical protein
MHYAGATVKGKQGDEVAIADTFIAKLAVVYGYFALLGFHKIPSLQKSYQIDTFNM